MKILLLSSDDNCLTQMSKGILKTFDSNAIICSAGFVNINNVVNSWAIRVLGEKGIDISNSQPRLIDDCKNESWGVVITIGGDTNAYREGFNTNVRRWVHVEFDKPSIPDGDEKMMLDVYRKLRDDLQRVLRYLYFDKIKNAGEVCSCGANDFCICH